MRYIIKDKVTGREYTTKNECGLRRFANVNRYEVRTENGTPLPEEALRALGLPVMENEPSTHGLARDCEKVTGRMEIQLRLLRLRAEDRLRVEENRIVRELVEEFPEEVRIQLEMAAERMQEAEEEQEAGNRFGASRIREEAEERLLQNLEALGLQETSRYMVIAMALV